MGLLALWTPFQEYLAVGVITGEGLILSTGIRGLMRLISSFSSFSCVLLSGRGFEITFFHCIKWFSVPGETLLCNDINTLMF